jgi:CHAT domain-containing protein/Tfp pilus assembly protein PilF
MRRFLLLLALLSACNRPRIQPIETEYSAAERLSKQGEWQEALEKADSGLRRCGSSSEWCWKFGLLKAETLVAGRKYKDALALLDSLGTPPGVDLQARRLMNQGYAWCRLAEYPRAEKLLDEALALARASPSALLSAEVEQRQGTLFMQTHKINDAETAFRHVQEAAARGGDPYLEANAMGNLGVLLMDTPRLGEAISWLQRAADIFARLGASKLSARTVGNLGVCNLNLGDTEKAQAAFKKAAAQFANAGDPCSEQIWLGHSGNAFLNEENFPAAIERYTRALAMAAKCVDKPSSAKWLINLALASIEGGQLDDAERYNNQSLELHKDPRLKLYNTVNSARIAAGRGQFAQAEELFRSLVNATTEDPGPSLEAQGGLAALYARAGDAPRADEQFRSAINVIESRQADLTKDDYKLSYLSSLIRFYRSYVDFLVQRGAVDRALEVVESSRSRILTERARTKVAVRHGLRTSDVQALARSSHHILLSYWLAPKQSYVWVITPAKIKLLPLPPEKEIRGLVESYRTAIEDGRDPIGSHLPAGERLSAILLRPLSELVPHRFRVVIVPDGALHSLNFDSLPSPSDPSKYWIEDIVVSVAPSLGLMLNSHPSRRSARLSLLAMGDPESPGQEYPRLPNAHKEVQAIAALFSAPSKVVYEGKELNPSAYGKVDPARFLLIHLAAHATANRESPLDSALILSPEGTGYTLTAREIMQIPLDADLVTLSSCRSAGAKAYSGEGLVGLTWAFLQAGARRVIAGLWDVDDESTSRLMAKLYEELARGVPPEDALRDAKLSLLHGAYPYKKPYYWGPFQLYVGTEK